MAEKYAWVIYLQREMIMKKALVWMVSSVVGGARRISFLLLAIILCTATFWLYGCEQPGEVTAEGGRRHLRNLSINQQNFNSDLDRTFLFDKPSSLTDKRIPPDIGTPGRN